MAITVILMEKLILTPTDAPKFIQLFLAFFLFNRPVDVFPPVS